MADLSKNVVLIEQADQLASEARWNEARELYHQALQAHPGDMELHLHVLDMATQAGDYAEIISRNMAVAELCAQNGEYDAARSRYKDVIDLEQEARNGNARINPSELVNLVAQVKPEIFAKMGDIDILEGKAEDAINWLKPSLELAPSRWETHMAMGRAFMATGQDQKAIGEFQEVVRLAPQDAATAYEMLGDVYLRMGRPSQSTAVWFRNAGELFTQRGQLRDAMRTYERILAFDPNNKDILIRLADIYSDEHIYDKAAGVYATLINIYEQDKDSDQDKVKDKIIDYSERLLECDPQNVEARNRLLNIYGDILQKDPNNVAVRVRLADCMAASGMLNEAAEQRMYLAQGYFDHNMLDDAYGVVCLILESVPAHIAARRMLGDLYKRRDMTTEALAEYQEVVRLYRAAGDDNAAFELQHLLVEMFPEITDLKYKLTLDLRAQGNHPGAINELLRILSDNPNDMVAKGYLGEEYSALGDWDGAVQVYRSMLDSDPGRTDIRKRLIKHFLEVGELNDALLDIRCLADDDFEKMSFLYRIIEICMEHERYDDVERYAAVLPEDDERLIGFRKELINRFLQNNNWSRAEANLALIPRTDKDRNRLVSSLLEKYMESGNCEAVASMLERLPQDDPLRLTFQHRLIASYQEQGRLGEAKLEMLRLPDDDDLLLEFMKRQITCLMNEKRYDEAVTEINLLPDSSPVKSSFMGQLVEAHLQNGDIDKAAVEVSRLSNDEEIASRCKRRLVQAYLNADRLQEAERDILALDDRDREKTSFLRLLLQRYEASGEIERLRALALQLPDHMVEKQQYLEGVAHSYLSSGDLTAGRQEVYNMAESVSASGNHYEAEHLYSKLLAWYPVDIDIRLRLCQELASQGKLERAREGMLVLAGRFLSEGNATSAADIYVRLLEIDPDNFNARYRLGDIWAEQGQSAQALEQFSMLAAVYLQQNLPEAAQRVLHRILELDPKDIEHRRQLIQLLTRNLRFEEATENHRKLLEIYLERGELEEARACVRDIVVLQPLNLDLRQRLGEMFLGAGFLEEGQHLMEELAYTYKGRGDHANVVKVFSTLSKIFENNQQWDTSLEYLERVADEQVEADMWPEAQNNYIHALKMYLLRGRKDIIDPLFVRLIDGFFRHRSVNQGIKLLEQLEAFFSEQHRLDLSLVIKDRLASIMERLTEWSQALELVSSISQDFLTLNDTDQAIAYCRRAADLALNHDMHERGMDILFRLLSMILTYRGYEAALPLMDELRQRSLGNANVIEKLGDALFIKDMLDEARLVYEEVLDISPDNVSALSRLAVIYARDNKLDEIAALSRKVVTDGLIGRVVKEYTDVLRADNDEFTFHLRLGEFFQQIGFLDEAIVEYDKASRDPAKVLQAVNHLAMAFSKKGYNSLATKQLVRILEQPGFSDEELLELRYNLAHIWEEEGQIKEALQAYQDCYAVDLDFRDVADRIDDLLSKTDGDQYNSDVYVYDEFEGDYDEEV